MQKLAKGTLLVIGLLTAFFIWETRKLSFDYDYEKYFPKEDSSMQEFEAFRDEYGGDSDFLLVGLKNKAGIFDVDFLKKVKAYGDLLAKDTLVDFVASPVHNCGYYKKAGLNGVVFKPYLDLTKSNISSSDSLFMLGNNQLIGSVLSSKVDAVCLFIETAPNLNKEEAKHIIALVENSVDQFGFDEFRFAGRVLAQTYFVETMIGELGIFISSSMLLLVGFLYISFRSWWGVVIPLVVVIVSIIWTLAIMIYTGKSFDLLMVMLPTIIFVVGMSDLVHLLTKYLDELRKGNPKMTALKTAFKEVRWATFLTSLTTSIGFFALIFANIVPIREFGIYAGVSVFVAYFLAFTLLPSVLAIVEPPKKLLASEQSNFWDKYLRFSFVWVFNNKVKVGLFTLAITVLGVFTANNLQIDNFLLEDLDDNDPIKRDVLFFENNFSGLRPFEAQVTAVRSNVFDFEFLQELEKVEQYLHANYTEEGVGFLISPLAIVKEANFIKRGSQNEDRRLPKTERRHKTLMKLINQGANQSSSGLKAFGSFNFISSDSLSCRITGKVKDVGGLAIKGENAEFSEFINNNINPDILKVKLTGTALLIDKNNATLAKSLLLGLVLAFAIIGCVIAFMFRSLKIALLSLIPNVLPLLLVTVVMWLGDIDLKISTSLIFTLAFGIAVDDTLHLLAKYKIEINKGRSHLYALKRSYLSSGKAILVTSLILIGGFLTLMFSSFTSTFYMGLLVSVTLIFAVVLDLMIMPLIMQYGLFKKGV